MKPMTPSKRCLLTLVAAVALAAPAAAEAFTIKSSVTGQCVTSPMIGYYVYMGSCSWATKFATSSDGYGMKIHLSGNPDACLAAVGGGAQVLSPCPGLRSARWTSQWETYGTYRWLTLSTVDASYREYLVANPGDYWAWTYPSWKVSGYFPNKGWSFPSGIVGPTR